MPRFLIEVPHKNQKQECIRVVNVFKKTGSHFLTNADWGCTDDVHKAWITIDIDNKKEALNIVPPWYRDKTRVINLRKFALDKIEEDIKKHKD